MNCFYIHQTLLDEYSKQNVSMFNSQKHFIKPLGVNAAFRSISALDLCE